MPVFWAMVGISAAVVWTGILIWSDRVPRRRLWPPLQGRISTAVWAWALTILIYVGAIQASFADQNALGLPGWLRWGMGGALSVLGSVPHTWGTLVLGLRATSGWPVPLVTTGIYGWRRHPQYLGQATMLIGIATMGGTVWAFLPALAGAAALALAARVEDRHLQNTAPAHDAYRRATRFLL